MKCTIKEQISELEFEIKDLKKDLDKYGNVNLEELEILKNDEIWIPLGYKRCWCCDGSGYQLGAYSVRQDCNNCGGFGYEKKE